MHHHPPMARKLGGRIFFSGLIALCIFVASFSSSAADSATKTASVSPESEKITVDSVDLRAQQFFKSYMSGSEQERKTAEIYLLGVMDATEGTVWCDYRTFKTDTLRERVFIEFKKLNERQTAARASKVIVDILAKRYPCRRKK